ncbi:hypothetical protein ABC502_00545 [Alkalimonas sp. NCh-2]|uniref:hypothetical protein n=1 Tax=Alkalimonas sp. NCh-2 TaxID=3144846 RepID=UPI0031F65A9D
MGINKFTWKAFWVRQIKMYVPLIAVVYFFWYGVEIGDAIYEYFGWVSEGYGPPQQRWYRVIASGFVTWGVIITLMDLIGTWHHIKHPDEIPKDDEVKKD